MRFIYNVNKGFHELQLWPLPSKSTLKDAVHFLVVVTAIRNKHWPSSNWQNNFVKDYLI